MVIAVLNLAESASAQPPRNFIYVLLAGSDPISEASHWGAGVVALVYWISFGLLASYIVPNFVVLFAPVGAVQPHALPSAKAPVGALSVAVEGLLTGAVSALIPAVALFLYGRRII